MDAPAAGSLSTAGCPSGAWKRLLSRLWIAVGVGVHGVAGQGLTPEAAVSRMKPAADLEVQCVASEPMITQPVCIEFDDRGRLWVIQYLQYPNPAGLQRTFVDRWSRTTYDHVPEPPPRGPRGADRITILEDTDGDGSADASHDFVAGLNLATGLAFGHGGVFVLNVPYLLYYPDRDRNDVPDADPVVCLEGFGMEDAHSVANSLTWGPDGWLYGCQGSTVTSRVRGIEFQQGVWRYHPLTREFELFCEGGGNAWGLDFDADGELIYSTNVGPFRHLHGVQGGFYWKSIGKHGALHHPYAFGHFDHIPHTNFSGGHVTVGGVVYRGTNLPPRFHGTYFCGDLLGHTVQWHDFFPRGSTFASAHGGWLLDSRDPWFAPSDLTVAPDGSVYVADWHDARTAHPDPDATWDRSNGRIYRLSRRGSRPWKPPDLRHVPTPDVLGWLVGENDWMQRRARRLLADRRDPSAILPLRTRCLGSTDARAALECLWAVEVSGGVTLDFAAALLHHPVPAVRKWSVRLLGDRRMVSPAVASALSTLARSEPDVRVRMQLAATARRLPAADALPLIESLLLRDADAADPLIPLLLWWAVERHAVSALREIEALMTSASAARSALVRDTIVARLLRRWIAERSEMTDDACARMIEGATDVPSRRRWLGAVDLGLREEPAPTGFGTGGLFARSAAVEGPPPTPGHLRAKLSRKLCGTIGRHWDSRSVDPAEIRVGVVAGVEGALVRARGLVGDAGADPLLRAALVSVLAAGNNAADDSLLLKLLGDGSEPIQKAVLEALGRRDGIALGRAMLDRRPGLGLALRNHLHEILLSRRTWAHELLGDVDAGRLAPAEIQAGQLRVVAVHGDPVLDALVRKHWGRMGAGTREERLAEMRRISNDLNAGSGSAGRGRSLFERLCLHCHSMAGSGGTVGPDLTRANRADREFLLSSIVDPSAAIRREYLGFEVTLADGRVFSGVILAQNASNLVLGTATGERVELPRADIASQREQAVSVMPDGLLSGLSPQELRDLFAYLQQDPPPATSLSP